jgi:hypothetical protein
MFVCCYFFLEGEVPRNDTAVRKQILDAHSTAFERRTWTILVSFNSLEDSMIIGL